MDDEPRYYVRQSFRDKPGMSTGRPATIAFASDDSRYAHLALSSRRFRVRADAARYCDALNAEHEENVHGARV